MKPKNNAVQRSRKLIGVLLRGFSPLWEPSPAWNRFTLQCTGWSAGCVSANCKCCEKCHNMLTWEKGTFLRTQMSGGALVRFTFVGCVTEQWKYLNGDPFQWTVSYCDYLQLCSVCLQLQWKVSQNAAAGGRDIFEGTSVRLCLKGVSLMRESWWNRTLIACLPRL